MEGGGGGRVGGREREGGRERRREKEGDVDSQTRRERGRTSFFHLQSSQGH